MKVFQLILDETTDADLITWLDSQPRGRKNDAARATLRAGLQQQDNNGLLRDILSEVRRLRTTGAVVATGPTQPATSEDDEIAGNLDKLLGL